MPTSYSIGNHLNLVSLGARAARSYAAELPKEAMQAVTRLEGMYDELCDLNARQEKAKQQLALLTRELKAKKQESMRERARLIRLAEATFGPRDPRIKEFRPATEGKVRTARGEGTRRQAKKDHREPHEPLSVGLTRAAPARPAGEETSSQPPFPLRSPPPEQADPGRPDRGMEGRPPERRPPPPSVPSVRGRPVEALPRVSHGGRSQDPGGLGHLGALRTEAWAPSPLPLLLRDPAWRVGIFV